LKPGELAYDQIASFVEESREGVLQNFSLNLRDSLPMVMEAPNWKVGGYLVWPKESEESIFWETVNSYEGGLYTKPQLKEVQVNNEIVSAKVFIGKSPDKGNPTLLYTPWSSKMDIHIAWSFPLLVNEIQEFIPVSAQGEGMQNLEYWRAMNFLTSRYLLLISILEHILVLKFGRSEGINSRNEAFQRSQDFIDAYEQTKIQNGIYADEISDARNFDSYKTDSYKHCVEAWYQARSNLQHTGKGNLRDSIVIYNSAISLSNCLVNYLEQKVPKIQEQWQKVLQKPLLIKSFPNNH
jgi:hypothetical protein